MSLVRFSNATPSALAAALACAIAAAAATARAADARAVAEAERLAASARATCARSPAEGLVQARRALELTAGFEPTSFVAAGRKGEVVEDAYLAARAAYREHRAGLYGATGACLAAAGQEREAARYLRRAFDLDRGRPQATALARVSVALGKPREALKLLLGGPAALDAEALALAGEAADGAGVPSLQAEIDRARLLALEKDRRPEVRDGPFRLKERTRLSNGVIADLEQEVLTILYNSEASCRSCSADLLAIRRHAPREARVLVSAPGPEADRALRQVLSLYRHDWPVIVGGGADQALGLDAPSMMVIARRGFLGAVLRPPFQGLPEVLDLVSRTDAHETLPRPQWSRRPVDRSPLAGAPGLSPEGLALGEDEAAPQAFSDALAAYRAGRLRDALRLFDEVAKRGDGFLLPPEARFNRGLCLLGLGQRETARVLLLETGDSRFQEAVDRALESFGSRSRAKIE